MKHGLQEIVGGYAITHLDPIMSLGRLTKVSAMYRARKHGASPVDDCLIFVEKGKATCYRHLVCEAMPAVDEVRAREVPERRAEAVAP